MSHVKKLKDWPMVAVSPWVPYQPQKKKMVVKMYRAIRPRSPARMAGGRSQDVSKCFFSSVDLSTPKRVVSGIRRMVVCALPDATLALTMRQ